MKKIIFIFTLLCFTASFAPKAQAQGTEALKCGYPVTGNYSSSNTKTVDSCTNVTDTVYFFFSAANMKNGSFVFRGTRVSGTCVVTGYMEGSNDGISWCANPTGANYGADTLNLSPAAAVTKIGKFTVPQNNFRYYRFRFVGHATGVVRITGYACTRRD